MISDIIIGHHANAMQKYIILVFEFGLRKRRIVLFVEKIISQKQHHV
jgi:hypothetical protein